MNTFTAQFETSQFNQIKNFFEERQAEFTNQQYAVFRAKTPDGVSVLYNSGKFLMQGKDINKLLTAFQTALDIQPPTSPKIIQEKNKIEKADLLIPLPHIGVDESGKGDFFGPLVIAGVITDENNSRKFIEAGIKDSKKLSDEKILKLSGIIKANAIHSVVVIGNEKYNELYTKFANLNMLLAWGHARVIENILEKKHCDYALSDKFGNENLIKNALLTKGRTITLEQRVRAEDDIAVAAASVIARAEYVNRMTTLSNRYEIKLPKGASKQVITAGREFLQKYGKDKLKHIAKIHFKTFKQI